MSVGNEIQKMTLFFMKAVTINNFQVGVLIAEVSV